ncbi:MAG: helix-turn-helix transcriptional regulator [Parvibaculaceae bacterium]|nr:helix-turn-helix transcriptional regulator [Parvibaculaceae bacterium]
MTDAHARRRELGQFIRTHRERLDPASLGLGSTGRRRTPGLRREEAAQLCGMSVTWFTFLEQGRDISVSVDSLARLAASLRLNMAERAYLFELAGRRDPAPDDGEAGAPPPALADCLAAISVPAYLLDRLWNVFLWNEPAAALFTGWLDQDDGERNLLDFMFLSGDAPKLVPDFEARARRLVAEFRAGAGVHLNDADVKQLTNRLQGQSPLFDRLWQAHDVVAPEGGERHFMHPLRGSLSYVQSSFGVAGRPDLRLVMLTPA